MFGRGIKGVSAFKHDRVWKVSCPVLLPNMVVFGAVRGRAWRRFWACFLAPFWWPFRVRFLASVGVAFLGRLCGGPAVGAAPVRCAAAFVRRGLVRWGGAVRGVRALRGCASCPVCARPGRSWRRVCLFFVVGFFGARGAGVLLLRAPRALRFFFFGRVACLPGGFLFRFFILFFCLFCFVFTSAPCRCVSVSVAASPPVLRAASLFSFSAALKKSLKFFLPAFKQGP